jgi:hypothetical protein
MRPVDAESGTVGPLHSPPVRAKAQEFSNWCSAALAQESLPDPVQAVFVARDRGEHPSPGADNRITAKSLLADITVQCARAPRALGRNSKAVRTWCSLGKFPAHLQSTLSQWMLTSRRGMARCRGRHRIVPQRPRDGLQPRLGQQDRQASREVLRIMPIVRQIDFDLRPRPRSSRLRMFHHPRQPHLRLGKLIMVHVPRQHHPPHHSPLRNRCRR